MENRAQIQKAQSCASGAREAVLEFHAAVAQPDMALVVFYCSADYDLEVVALEMRDAFAGTQVVGCTTAGEIGPAGCRDHTISGASFPRSSFTAVSGLLDHLQEFQTATGYAFAQEQLQKIESLAPQANDLNTFGLMLIDGLSVREEPVTRALQSALGQLSLVGGSAGDGLRFGRTSVFFEGRFHSDSAILTLITTDLPFTVFKTQHFVATDERLVVTEADPTGRTVKEINGLPAAQEYARVVGIDANDLDPARFATRPVVAVIDGANYVRSIQKANADGSLTFFCAIEEGLVLRVAKGVDLFENLEAAFAQIRAQVGDPQLVLGYDCLHRKLETARSVDAARVEQLLLRSNTVGFNTYGEQFRGVHINQTLVGVAIGKPGARAHIA